VYPACGGECGAFSGRGDAVRYAPTHVSAQEGRRRRAGVLSAALPRLCPGIRERAELLWGKPARRGRVRGVVDEGTRLRSVPRPTCDSLTGVSTAVGEGGGDEGVNSCE
jgi:hypothetical protein